MEYAGYGNFVNLRFAPAASQFILIISLQLDSLKYVPLYYH